MLAAQHETFMTARYALYFMPDPASPWHRFGEQWLAQEGAPGIAAARHYGFHATLKAPFRLAGGTRLADLVQALNQYCAAQAGFQLPGLALAWLDDFLALVPVVPESRLHRLAADCVAGFERFRAPADAAELARRAHPGLTATQRMNLARWGYPYVFESFRFHLSLTGRLRPAEGRHAGLWREAAHRLSALGNPPLAINAVCIAEETAPDAAFRVIHRAPLAPGAARKGRLVCLVGPSGCGKDSLIAWARRNLPAGRDVRFATRTITRAATAGEEVHVPVDDRVFDRLIAQGAFALHWRANGHRYGIGTEVRAWLDQGATVVMNGSREHLDELLRTFPAAEVVHVRAPESALRARIAARAREDAAGAAARMARNQREWARVEAPALEIVNDGAPELAARQLLRFIATPP